MSSYVVTYVSRAGSRPRSLNVDLDERQARQFCQGYARSVHRVVLNAVDGNGLHTAVARWEGGRSKRNLPNGVAPRPVVIEGEIANADEVTEDDEAIADIVAEDEATYDGWCVKCKEPRSFHGEVGEMANGRRAAFGTCPVCGTKMNRILANLPHDEQDSFDTPDDEPTPEDVEAGNADMPLTDETGDVLDEITEAISDAVPEGTPVAEVAAATTAVAVEFSNAEAEAEAKPAPRKRAPRKAAQKATDNSDADAASVRDLPVATCPNCSKKVPVMTKAGLAIFMVHPDAGKGLDRCPGSTTVVN